MAKELERFRKEIAKLKKDAEDCEHAYAGHETNRKHLKDMLLETAKEIGRAVQKCKDDGAEGKKLEAFEGSGNIDKLLRTGKDFISDLRTEEKRLKKILSDAEACKTSIDKLDKEIEADIKNRSAKKTRAIAPVDSKSLPEIQKLPPEIAKIRRSLMENVITSEKDQGWSADQDEKAFERWKADEVAKTKESRGARDTKETDGQAVNIRVLKGAQGKFETQSKLADGYLESARKLNGQRRFVEAGSDLKKAEDCIETMADIAAPYVRHKSELRPFDIKAMEQTNDGKLILRTIEDMETALSDARKALKKLDRVTA